MNKQTRQLIENYYAAFNAGDMEKFFSLLTEDIIHDINQGGIEIGKEKFRKFMVHMEDCYQEKTSEMQIFTNEEGSRAAAEFVITGTYLKTDGKLPAANGQQYALPCGAFFTIVQGKIARVTMYYNLQDWLKQIGNPK